MPLPGTQARNEFILDYSLQLAIAICLDASMGKKMFCYLWLDLVKTLLM